MQTRIPLQREIRVSLADLRYVSIECPECHTRVLLDMLKPSDFSEKYHVFTPKECPGCRRAYDSAISSNVDEFQRAYMALKEVADRISFIGIPEQVD